MQTTGVNIDQQLNHLFKKMDKMAMGLSKELQQNRRVRQEASKFIIPIMKSKVPEKTGKLKDTVGFIKLRSSLVMIGPSFRPTRHAGLVEFGFVHHKSKKFVPGVFYVRNTYDETKQQLLRNLVNVAKQEFDKIGRNLEGIG